MTEEHAAPSTSHGEHREHDGSGENADPRPSGLNSMAAAATLHCLTGCAIGEIVGLVIGTAAGLSSAWTIALSIALAFVFGFSLSSLPLLRAGLTVGATLSVVVAADTLSIATMEVVDNAVMALIPGAMNAGLVTVVFWVGMMIALAVAFVAAYPVNRWLLQRGRGHALTHEYHHAADEATGWRRAVPSFPTATLVAVLVAFMVGGLVVSAADDLADDGARGGAIAPSSASGTGASPSPQDRAAVAVLSSVA